MLKQIMKKIFPPGSRMFIILKRIAVKLGLATLLPLHEIQYNEWCSRVEPLSWPSQDNDFAYRPLISIVVPVFNPQEVHFLQMVHSVVSQGYQNWELILVNASSDRRARLFTKEAELIDNRIVVFDLIKNEGIAANTNAGIKRAKGEYIGFLDHDDVLAAEALHEVVRTLQTVSRPQLIYSDEDKLTNNSEFRVDPHFKPDWSPQLLRELNYINHFSVVETKLLEEVGVYREGLDGAQDYDLFLRLADATTHITHIPRVLYHWRTAKTSTAENFSQKKNILSAGVKALHDHLDRNHQQGEIVPIKGQPGFYKIKYAVKEDTTLAILILPSSLQMEYRKFIFTFLENIKKTGQIVEVFTQPLKVPLKTIPTNVTLHAVHESQRTAFIKTVTRQTTANLCLIVDCALLPVGKQWLSSLTGLLSQVQSIAIAAPQIMSGDRKTIIDSGYVRMPGTYLPLFQGYPDKQHTPFGNSNWARNVDAVSSRCFIIRTSLLSSSIDQLRETGSLLFSKKFFEDLHDQGHEVVSWPFSRVIYAGEMNLPAQSSPHFNPNLVVSKTEFTTFEAMSVSRSYKDE